MKTAPLAGLAALAAVVMVGAAQAADVEWKLDGSHSEVGFSVRHLGISKVKGEFTDFTAELRGDAESGNLSYVKGVVKTASVDTGNEGRDDHLQQDDFFNAGKYPDMVLEATRIRWVGDRFYATATLTIRDQTHDVTVKGEKLGVRTVDFGRGPARRAGYSAEFKIDRQKFGLRFNRLAEGVSVVGNEVTVELEIEAIRAEN